MARVAVDVVIKPEILDPQGKAILAALGRGGHSGVLAVRQGKHFDLEVDESVSDEDLEEIAGTLLANPVIETWTVTRLDEVSASPAAALPGAAAGEDAAVLR
ncbi:phosphoribosylformylglycinamidine synthase subunit PurS [Nakamurella endophytica]|uniref:phosphoribosylformylglycinamidine synthase subunit PurS n=1 Tax=Nakamurella endophytica TaxID=1748367 RepID=UPI00166BBFF3|nr:phosphoribosylformylglycinamidine synthase subunit PurS [Nakamurella endophytica]